MGSRHLWTLTFFCLTAALCKATRRVTLERPSIEMHQGDTVIVRCVGSDMENVNIFKTGEMVQGDSSHQIIRTNTTVELRIISMTWEAVGLFSCVSNGSRVSGETSLGVNGWRRHISLETSSELIPPQGSVTMTCSVGFRDEFPNIQWFRCRSDSDTEREILHENTTTVSVSRGGVYFCRGVRKFIITEDSDAVHIWETVSNKTVVQSTSAEVFSGDSLSLRCEVDGGSDSEWSYEWRRSGVILPTATREYALSKVSTSDSGNYSCRGKRENYQTTAWSQETRLQVLMSEKTSPSVFVLVLVGGLCLLVGLIVLMVFEHYKERKAKLSEVS